VNAGVRDQPVAARERGVRPPSGGERRQRRAAGARRHTQHLKFVIAREDYVDRARRQPRGGQVRIAGCPTVKQVTELDDPAPAVAPPPLVDRVHRTQQCPHRPRTGVYIADHDFDHENSGPKLQSLLARDVNILYSFVPRPAASEVSVTRSPKR
jgi:hypothetical protein